MKGEHNEPGVRLRVFTEAGLNPDQVRRDGVSAQVQRRGGALVELVVNDAEWRAFGARRGDALVVTGAGMHDVRARVTDDGAIALKRDVEAKHVRIRLAQTLTPSRSGRRRKGSADSMPVSSREPEEPPTSSKSSWKCPSRHGDRP